MEMETHKKNVLVVLCFSMFSRPTEAIFQSTYMPPTTSRRLVVWSEKFTKNRVLESGGNI